MEYRAAIDISSTGKHFDNAQLTIGEEGIKTPAGFFDYADIIRFVPNNFRVYIYTVNNTTLTVSMLGHSFAGFCEELAACFNARSLQALFIEEECIMDCQGEFQIPVTSVSPAEQGRGRIALYPDAVCILPESSQAVRIPLCFASNISLDGYIIRITMRTGEVYYFGKMGYDTKPFAERCIKYAGDSVKKRNALLSQIEVSAPYTGKGLFRTADEDKYWASAFGQYCCAVELFTDENTATYLYRFTDRPLFSYRLEEAMEAVGSHREIIFMDDDKLRQNPLYRMAVHRSEAVRFLRSCTAGRIIHTESHDEKLRQFLSGN
ncbi:MAG: hypothetical protein IJJ74_05835 [Eubacterium sp.]|nr:hypothetical protein [Eubacterium sp.]